MSVANGKLTIVLTAIQADVLRELLDRQEADNKRHNDRRRYSTTPPMPEPTPKLRTRILREIRQKL